MELGIIVALAAQAAALPVQSELRQPSWEYAETRDQMTDAVKARIFVLSQDAAFFVKCDGESNDEIYLQFASTEFLGGSTSYRNMYRDFTYRFDDDEALTGSWRYVDQGAAAFSASEVRSFLDRLRAAHRLRVRAYTYRGRAVDADFDIHGADAMLDRLLKVCKRP